MTCPALWLYTRITKSITYTFPLFYCAAVYTQDELVDRNVICLDYISTCEMKETGTWKGEREKVENKSKSSAIDLHDAQLLNETEKSCLPINTSNKYLYVPYAFAAAVEHQKRDFGVFSFETIETFSCILLYRLINSVLSKMKSAPGSLKIGREMTNVT